MSASFSAFAFRNLICKSHRQLASVIRGEKICSLNFRRSVPLVSSVRSFSVSQEATDDMENLQKNPFYAKYAEKLQKKQEANPTEFQAKLDELEEHRKQKEEETKKQIEEMIEAKKAQQNKPSTLDSVVKLELLKDKTSEEIEEIWKEYHRSKDCVFAVILRAEYEEIYKRTQEFPTFIYPIPREGGYEFMLQQANQHEIHFTSLIQYQTHKENAPSCLVMHHYTELIEDKGIVLMHGYPDTNYLSIHESQLLALQVKLYYGLQSGLKFNLVRMFSASPETFRHMDLIKEFENYKKDLVTSRNREF